MGEVLLYTERLRCRAMWHGIANAFKNKLLRRNVKRFRGGLVFKAHRLLYHSTLGLRVIT